MDYRLLAEEVAKVSQDFGGTQLIIRLGEITLEQEKDLVTQMNIQPSDHFTELSFETIKSLDYTDKVYFSYSIRKTKETKIVELERELAALKGEFAHA